MRSDRFHQLPDGALLYALHDSAQEKYGELPRCPLGVCGEGTATSAAQCALLDDGGEVVRHVRRIESSPASAEVEPDPVPEALHSFARALSSSGFEPFHEDAPPATESVGDMAEIDATASYGECRLSRLISEGSRPPEPRTVPVRGSKTPPAERSWSSIEEASAALSGEQRARAAAGLSLPAKERTGPIVPPTVPHPTRNQPKPRRKKVVAAVSAEKPETREKGESGAGAVSPLPADLSALLSEKANFQTFSGIPVMKPAPPLPKPANPS